jgi:hypothetical protein
LITLSPKNILLEQDFKNALEHAKAEISQDDRATEIIKSMRPGKVKQVDRRQLEKLNKLALLGVIYLYMNDTYELSRLGIRLIRLPLL